MNPLYKEHIELHELIKALDERTDIMLKQEDGAYISTLKKFFKDNVVSVLVEAVDRFDGRKTRTIVIKDNLKNLDKIKSKSKALANNRFSQYEGLEFPVITGINVDYLKFTEDFIALEDFMSKAINAISTFNTFLAEIIGNVNDESKKLKLIRQNKNWRVEWAIDGFVSDVIGTNNNKDKLPFSRLFPSMGSIPVVRDNFVTINKYLLDSNLEGLNDEVVVLNNNLKVWIEEKDKTQHSKEVISFIKEHVGDLAQIISLVGIVNHLAVDASSYFYNTIQDVK